MYPRIVKRIGYRRSVMLGLFIFSIMTILFPLSNVITGPITQEYEGSGDFNSNTSIVNTSTGLDFCGHNLTTDGSENLVNENSVIRVPVRVWAWLTFHMTLWVISRLVYYSRTSLIQAEWDQRVPISWILPVTVKIRF